MPSSLNQPATTNGHAAPLSFPPSPAIEGIQPTSAASSGEVLVRVENVSKKFCRSLKKSLWYGLKDMAGELDPRARHSEGDHGHRPALRADEFWAVDDVSFELRRGECLGLIGHNGAGKTTLLKMLNGLLKPDAGRIEMRGRVGALIALGAGFNPILTGRENVYVNASILGLTKREIDEKFDEIIDYAEIGEFIDAPVQSYSSGMAVRLGFAVAANLKPDVLLLDEVLAVGDVGFQAKCFNTLARARESGTAFILVSHNLHQITRYSDRVLHLQKGALHFLGGTEVGVDRFVNSMSGTAAAPEEETDWTEVYGSGAIRMTGAIFQGPDGTRRTTVATGEPFTLVVPFECSSPGLTNVVLDVVIRDKEGTLFQGTNQDAHCTFGPLNRTGQFSVDFAGLPVNVNRVHFFLAVMDGRTKQLYDWKRHIPLQLDRAQSAVGKLSITTQWQVK